MKQSLRNAGVGVALTLVLSMFAGVSVGCGAFDTNGLLGLETCDILNCDGLFFGYLAGDHDDDADDHADDADDHVDEADDHDDAEDDHADDADDHGDNEVEGSENHAHG